MMGRPVPLLRQDVNNINVDCAAVDDDNDDVVKTILGMNTTSKTVVGFRSYNDTATNVDVEGQGVTTTSAAVTATATTPERVLNHYRNMRTYQTVDFHNRMMEKYTFHNGKYRYVILLWLDGTTAQVLKRIIDE
jgi:hypothetical protein